MMPCPPIDLDDLDLEIEIPDEAVSSLARTQDLLSLLDPQEAPTDPHNLEERGRRVRDAHRTIVGTKKVLVH